MACSSIAVFNEVVHWRRNLFLVPYGCVGRDSVHDLAKIFLSYGEAGAFEPIAIKAAMLMCALLLQKPHSRMSGRDLASCLQRRRSLWNQGDIDALLIEGHTIQHQLLSHSGSCQKFDDDHHISRHFVECMLRGNVRSALNSITCEQSGVPLRLDSPVSPDNPSWLVLDELKKKHPIGRPASLAVLLPPPAHDSPFHPVIFDVLDGAAIHSAALQTKGAAGPLGLDAYGWRRLCTSFQGASNDLCDGLASVARRLCTSYVDPAGIAALVAGRLITLDKNPGVRPIGVGEVIRRIISKALLSVVKLDILDATGYSQLCAGQDAGNKAAVHAMREIYGDASTEAVLLVDASNAFNNLNCQVALRNIQTLCPSLATILINTYREDVPLFIDNRCILSSEGTTQGDPLAMAMYSVGVTPLINDLQGSRARQVWFADDATTGGSLIGLYNWWCRLRSLGPSYGYFVNASKT